MSTPPEQQVQGSPDTSSASMVRVCDRCGTVCSSDQEWCLNCGVRMTEAGKGLPGLRAAGLVVALAVLLAGGAAAASYAALRGDARSAANVPGETTPAPVAQVPATPAPAVPAAPAPVTSTPTPAPAPSSSAKRTPTPTPAPATPTPAPATPATPSAGSSSSGGSSGGSSGSGSSSSGSGGSGSSGGSGGSSGSGGSGSGSGSGSTGTSTTPSGPIVFASGQGSIYDPGDLVSDENKGDEGNAIDGSTGTSWKVTLNDGATGGIGYVLDFDTATTVKRLKINTATSGLEIKVLGTTRSALPPDVNDNRWDTIATDRTLKSGSTTVPLKAVSGASSKYRHVLVVFTTVPGTPPSATIREFTASR